jgi:Na+-transporting methylmalonyl-CoA/oxaloacetate decarboxylase gamma subunit
MAHPLHRRGMGGAGLGLLVLLLALLIILVMYFGNFGGKSYMQNVATARKSAIQLKADIDTHNLTELIEACYLSNNSKLPQTPEETDQPGVFMDQWHHPITFTYKKEGDKTFVVYHSNGPDGEPNTEDDVVKTDQLSI